MDNLYNDSTLAIMSLKSFKSTDDIGHDSELDAFYNEHINELFTTTFHCTFCAIHFL